MRYDPDRHHRRSIRLSGYDYSQPGAYFITICTCERACLFGEVADGEIRLNEAGQMVLAEWNALTARFPSIQMDAFVVMPNHVHGILMITTNVGAGLVPAHHGQTMATTSGATTSGGNHIGGNHKGCPYGGGCGCGVQIPCDGLVYPWGKNMRVGTIRGASLATQLLRTHYPQRIVATGHSSIHRRQPVALASGSGESRFYNYRRRGAQHMADAQARPYGRPRGRSTMIADLKPYPAMEHSGATIAALPCREVLCWGDAGNWQRQPALALCRPQQAKNDRGVKAASLWCYEAPST